MGDRRTRGQLSYHNSRLRREERAMAISSANSRKIIVGSYHKPRFLSTNLTQFLNNDPTQFLNLNCFSLCGV
jgi:hypothetical protein